MKVATGRTNEELKAEARFISNLPPHILKQARDFEEVINLHDQFELESRIKPEMDFF